MLSFPWFRIKIRITMLMMPFLSFGLAFAEEPSQFDEIAPLVKQIEDKPDAMTQWYLGMRLENIVRTSTNSAKIGNCLIIKIAGLLSNRNVRVWAAAALGDIGPRAAITVPQLETALRESEAEEGLAKVGPDFSVAEKIREALSKITGKTYGPNY